MQILHSTPADAPLQSLIPNIKHYVWKGEGAQKMSLVSVDGWYPSIR